MRIGHKYILRDFYHGAATLVTVQPDAPSGQELKVEHAGAPPENGSAVMVAVRDGWIIPPPK